LATAACLAGAAAGFYASRQPPVPTRSPLALAATLAAAPKEAVPMPAAAQKFLATLRPDQRARAVFAVNDDERLDWHFVPRARKGVSFADLSAPQQAAVLALLRSGLSASGYQKVETIRSLETVLQQIEGDAEGKFRNPTHYYVSVFGEPAARGVWGWRYEGHHLSLHWTVVDGKVIASSPQFLGANPARVASGPLAGKRILGAEEDLGRALVKSLSEKQRAVAVLSPQAPGDILTGNQRVAAIQEDKGVAYRDLSPEQKRIFLSLLRAYTSTQSEPVAAQRLADLSRAGLDTIKFAWMGGLEPGQGHYYRVQGTTFLIEYDNTQNNANHVHSVWRSFKNDFGADLLAEHYKNAPHDDRK
jgi:hypothetical protein